MGTTTRSDAELKTDAEAELEWDPRVHRNEIGVAVIKEKIQQALVRSAETEADRIIVQVDGSKVTLGGAVRSYAEKQDAERAALAAPVSSRSITASACRRSRIGTSQVPFRDDGGPHANAWSSVIITMKPARNPSVAMSMVPDRTVSGISSSTTT